MLFDHPKTFRKYNESFQDNEKNHTSMGAKLTEAQDQINTLRTLVVKHRTDAEEVQEHCARIRKGQRILQNQHEILRAEARGSRRMEIYFNDVQEREPVSSKMVKDLLKTASEQVRKF